MKKFLLVIIALKLCVIQGWSIVKPGVEVLRDSEFEILKGKRVGLITNPTGVDSNLKSTVDILYESDKFELVALFGPEHGVRGDITAGEKFKDSNDKKTGLPVYSLYGKTKKPSKEMLRDIDVLVYDIQDIGCRSYTFISTMGLAMEACAENNIEFVILDRPNPLGGLKIEGNIVEKDFISFVSQYPVPYIYGMTCGELALYLNSEGLLSDRLKCDIKVVQMEGWKREMMFDDTGLPWVLTSPHIPDSNTALYYPATGILGELYQISIGVGYTLPFQLIGDEWMDADILARELNSYNLEGVKFRPINFKPYYTSKKGKNLKGVQVYFTDINRCNIMSLQFYAMQAIHKLYPDVDFFAKAENRWNMFDKVCGTNEIRLNFTKRYKFSDIKKILNRDITKFRNLSNKYYLYD